MNNLQILTALTTALNDYLTFKNSGVGKNTHIGLCCYFYQNHQWDYDSIEIILHPFLTTIPTTTSYWFPIGYSGVDGRIVLLRRAITHYSQLTEDEQ